jgi:HAD superfamily hydrolase (TIGR01456 family)
LQHHHIPFLLLTNGGGIPEPERAHKLSHQLGVSISPDALVQSHTPFSALALTDLRDKPVLVVGGEGDRCRIVAEGYGFRHVVTPRDILQQEPAVWPFANTEAKGVRSGGQGTKEELRVAAVLVFNDPRDWALDVQVAVDVLASEKGVVGTWSRRNGDHTLENNGWQMDGQPPIYFSNNDLLWAAAYHLPRLGQGAFGAALEGVWKMLTGVELRKTVIGKPFRRTYLFAEEKLRELKGKGTGELKTIYMVGDNPASDIRGANEFDSPYGTKWESVLVKTGVYKEGQTPMYRPTNTVADVWDAVRWAIEREGGE